jgi:hypothetical protein
MALSDKDGITFETDKTTNERISGRVSERLSRRLSLQTSGCIENQ